MISRGYRDTGNKVRNWFRIESISHPKVLASLSPFQPFSPSPLRLFPPRTLASLHSNLYITNERYIRNYLTNKNHYGKLLLDGHH